MQIDQDLLEPAHVGVQQGHSRIDRQIDRHVFLVRILLDHAQAGLADRRDRLVCPGCERWRVVDGCHSYAEAACQCVHATAVRPAAVLHGDGDCRRTVGIRYRREAQADSLEASVFQLQQVIDHPFVMIFGVRLNQAHPKTETIFARVLKDVPGAKETFDPPKTLYPLAEDQLIHQRT